jgi:hypothetical protein
MLCALPNPLQSPPFGGGKLEQTVAWFRRKTLKLNDLETAHSLFNLAPTVEQTVRQPAAFRPRVFLKSSNNVKKPLTAQESLE